MFRSSGSREKLNIPARRVGLNTGPLSHERGLVFFVGIA